MNGNVIKFSSAHTISKLQKDKHFLRSMVPDQEICIILTVTMKIEYKQIFFHRSQGFFTLRNVYSFTDFFVLVTVARLNIQVNYDIKKI